MDRLLTAITLMIILITGTACAQTSKKPTPSSTTESQLVPGAQAPFPVITFPASPSEPASPKAEASQTAGSGSSAPAPQHHAKKQDAVKKPIRVVRKPSHKQSVGAEDSAADFLNRQELSRITGAGY